MPLVSRCSGVYTARSQTSKACPSIRPAILPATPYPAEALHGGFNRFITFRNNVVNSNGGMVIRGTSANTLVTGSKIRNSHVGVHVNYTTTGMFGAEVCWTIALGCMRPACNGGGYVPRSATTACALIAC